MESSIQGSKKYATDCQYLNSCFSGIYPFSGKFGTELRVAIRGLQYPYKFLAKHIRGAWQSGDAREVLVRVGMTRFEVDMEEISNDFAVKTGWSVSNVVRSSGNGHKSYEFIGEFLIPGRATYTVTLLSHFKSFRSFMVFMSRCY